MKFRSRKPKPETGAEMSVIFMLPAAWNAEQCAEALVTFLGGINQLTEKIGAAWIKINCEVPEEYRDLVEAAFANAAGRFR